MNEHFEEDKFPDFREAIPTPAHLDTDGCIALLKAITIQTADDYYKVCDHPDGVVVGSGEMARLMSKENIEQFIHETMPTRGSKLISTIKKLKAQKKSLREVVKDSYVAEAKMASELDELYSDKMYVHRHRKSRTPVTKVV